MMVIAKFNFNPFTDDTTFIKVTKKLFIMKSLIPILTALLFLISACHKDKITEVVSGSNHLQIIVTSKDSINNIPVDTGSANSMAILVDASKDGGGWWFPQGSSGYSAANYHQGKAFADYLRKWGYTVDELPVAAVITTELLNKYTKVIRATAYYNYTTAEVAAYETFLNRSTSLLLISDHMGHTVNDRLSAHIGLNFEGALFGPITSFQTHPITTGVSSMAFIAGSVIKSWDPSKITVLGALNSSAGEEGSAGGAMGIVHHPTSKIFFIGDVNGIEQLPLPFTSNLVKWLFN